MAQHYRLGPTLAVTLHYIMQSIRGTLLSMALSWKYYNCNHPFLLFTGLVY